jgi:hypothetical protein
MAFAINLNHQAQGRAVKIHNEIVDRALPQDSMGKMAQAFLPQGLLCGSHSAAQRSRPLLQRRVIGQIEHRAINLNLPRSIASQPRPASQVIE